MEKGVNNKPRTGVMLFCCLWELFASKVNVSLYPIFASIFVAILVTRISLRLSGSTLEARGISGRIISIMLYIAVIFLYTSYSACIVALLQSTTDSIRDLEDLYHSGMGLGALDVVYSRHYFSVMPLKQILLLGAAYSLHAVSFPEVYDSCANICSYHLYIESVLRCSSRYFYT